MVKKSVFGVDGYYGAEEDGGDPLAWAEGQWADDGVEETGAVYDQDEMMAEFLIFQWFSDVFKRKPRIQL